MKFMAHLIVVISLVALCQGLSAPRTEEELAKNGHRAQTSCKGLYNGTLLAHPTDCHKFYVCVDNQPHEYNCNTNYHYDKSTRSCVAGSDCNNIEQEIPSTCTAGTIHAVVDDCYIFEACIDGQYQNINCPAGHYFYAPLSMCRPIHYNAHFRCNCVLPEHTVMKNHDNCETYYLCEGKKALLKQCPLGQYYNSTINACLVDLEGVCLMEPTKAPMVRVKSEAEKLIEIGAKAVCQRLGDQKVVFQPFDSDCDKFYVCSNGQLYAQECPKNFYYDSDKKFCVLDTEKKCMNGKLTTEQSQSTNEAKISAIVMPDQQLAEEIMLPPQALDKIFSKFMKL